MPIGFPFNPDQCAFISSAALNSNQSDPNVLDTDNLTPHNLLWNFVENKIQWVNTLTNIIVQELGGGGGPLPVDNKNIILVDQVFGNDATAVAYDMFKPFQTVDAAMAASVSGDLVFMNPAPFPYNAFNNIFDTVQGINFYLSKGAVFNVFFATIDSGSQDISIIGEGDVNFFTGPSLGNFTGNFTLQCNNFLLNGTFLTAGVFSGDINITVNKATLNSFFFLNNSGYWPIATKASNFNFSANDVVNNSILFVIYPATVQLNINVKNYFSAIGVGTADVWCFGAGAPTYIVTSHINFNNAIRDSSLGGYTPPFFNFVDATDNNTAFITGNYNFTGNGLISQAPAVITTPLWKGKIFFNGVANITNGTMLLDADAGATGRIRIEGKVYFNNPAFLVPDFTFVIFFVSQIRAEIAADAIGISPANSIVNLGRYDIPSIPIGQIDILDCEIVNNDPACPKAAITKGDLGIPWGTLRLFNAKVIAPITSIEGINVGEPVEVYSAYANTPQVSIANTIAGTAIITDPAVTSNDF